MMICYIESSVILRRLFGQPNALEEWSRWTDVKTSALTRVECSRAIDRRRVLEPVSDAETAASLQALSDILDRMGEIPLERMVLREAARAFPTIVGALDALHIASAALWKQQSGKEILFLTHDVQQGLAARAVGLKSEGFEPS